MLSSALWSVSLLGLGLDYVCLTAFDVSTAAVLASLDAIATELQLLCELLASTASLQSLYDGVVV